MSSILPFLLSFASLFPSPFSLAHINTYEDPYKSSSFPGDSRAGLEAVLPDGHNPKTSCNFRGRAWHQPSYIWLTSDLNLLSSMKRRTGDLLYQTIFSLSLNSLFIKENKTKVLMSTDEDNKDEPQRSRNGLHTHKPSQSLWLQCFPMGDNVKNVLECNTLR